mmetsp:Transcript_41332/g.70758  ORF Transcript_41332/g.70758 Transcript_41332/m.70758 type:complete len:80 (-) Transcript_41332:135-374(-)
MAIAWSSSMISMAAAPSFMDEAFPAVTVPFLSNAALKEGSFFKVDRVGFLIDADHFRWIITFATLFGPFYWCNVIIEYT